MKMKIAFLKLLKTEDLKTPLKNVKKMKTMSCAGAPTVLHEYENIFGFIMMRGFIYRLFTNYLAIEVWYTDLIQSQFKSTRA